MTSIGSIYVTVRGDDTQFKQDMGKIRSYARQAGTEVSESLNSAFSSQKASRNITALNTNLKQLAQTAKVPGDNFKVASRAIASGLEDVAREAGMTQKQFAALNEKMLRHQAYKQTENSLRSIARSADLSGKEIQQLAKQMGYSSKQARKMAGNIDRASRRTRGLTTSMGSFIKTMLPIVSGTLIVAGLKRLTTGAIEAGDAIAKTADKIGLSTDSLQEYRYAAERAGVDTKALDMGMQRFTRRLAEAVQGGGELKGVLEQYGIAVRDANGNIRSTEDVLKDLADAIQNAESDSERLRIAFKAFDSEGAALVNMLRDGADGLEKYRSRARELGLVIDEDLLRGAESAKDALSDLSDVIRISATKAILTLAPHIEGAAVKMTKWVTENEEFITQDIPGTILDISTAIGDLIGGISDAIKAIDSFADKWENVANAAKASKAIITRDWDAFAEAVKDGMNDAKKEVDAGMEDIQNAVSVEFDPMRIEGDTDPAKEEVLRLLDEIRRSEADVQVDADTSKARKALDELKKNMPGEIEPLEPISIDADPEPAKQAMDEVKNKADQTKDAIEDDPITPGVDDEEANQKWEDMEGRHKSAKRTIELNVISVPLDTSPAEVALERLQEKARGTIAGIMEHMAVAMANAENIGHHTTYRTEKRFRGMLESQKDFWNTATGYAETMVHSAPFGLDTGWQAGYGSGGGAGGDDEKPRPLGTYALGTGLSGVPMAGLYNLHQGEIVVPPDQSSQIRSIARAAGFASVSDMAALFSRDSASGSRGALASGGAGASGGSLAGGGAGVSGGSLGSGGAGASGGMQRVYNNSVTVAPTFMSGDAAAARHVAAEIKRALDEQMQRRR